MAIPRHGVLAVPLLLVAGLAAAIVAGPVAQAQCPDICKKICNTPPLHCTFADSSNNLDFYAGANQTTTVASSATSNQGSSPSTTGPTSGTGASSAAAGMAWFVSGWHDNATRIDTPVDIVITATSHVTMTSGSSVSYTHLHNENTESHAFNFTVESGFSGTASINYTVTTFANDTNKTDSFNGVIVFDVDGGSGASGGSTTSSPPPELFVTAAVLAGMALALRRRLPGMKAAASAGLRLVLAGRRGAVVGALRLSGLGLGPAPAGF